MLTSAICCGVFLTISLVGKHQITKRVEEECTKKNGLYDKWAQKSSERMAQK